VEEYEDRTLSNKMKTMNKKGQIGNLAPAIISLVLAAVILILGLVMLQEVRDTNIMTAGDEAYKATNETLTGMGTFGDFWEIIVLAVVITVVIGLLLTTFSGGRER